MSKINNLLNDTPHGTVLLSFWLSEKGYSLDLQKRYKKSGWLESIGTGALKRAGEDIDYHGGIYALQNQAGLSVHAGGTAINLFARDMPRLSVDIDLTYLPIEDRQTTLKNISDALERVKMVIEHALPDARVLHKSDVGMYRDVGLFYACKMA